MAQAQTIQVKTAHALTPAERESRRLRDACGEVEALFFAQLLREMRSSIPDDGLIPRGEGETMFQELLDGEYARIVGRTSTTGLAAMLYRQLSRDAAPAPAEKPAGNFSAQG